MRQILKKQIYEGVCEIGYLDNLIRSTANLYRKLEIYFLTISLLLKTIDDNLWYNRNIYP